MVDAESASAKEGASILIDVAASLSTLDKDKEAYWLAATVWEGRHVPARSGRRALEEALAAGLYREAVAICYDAHAQRRWRSGERAIDAIVGALEEGSTSPKRSADGRSGVRGSEAPSGSASPPP